jgi:hypothetical protein
MGRTVVALGCAAVLTVICHQSVEALPVSATAMQDAATAASPLQQAQYYERHTRHGVVKCYRDFVIGRYRCHRYWYW